MMEEKYAQVGHSTARIDGQDKVTGVAQYAADLHLPGMLHARLVVSPYAHARIKNIDTSAAKQIPGVVRVVTAAELPIKHEGADSRKLNPLASNEVLFYGQPVVAVLGETEAAALDGVAAVVVDYEPLPVVSNALDGMKKDAPRVRTGEAHGTDEDMGAHGGGASGGVDEEAKDLSPNVSNHVHFEQGDIAQGFKDADVIVENTFTLPMVHQSYIETQSCVAAPGPLGDITIYASTQSLFDTRKDVARALGIPLNKVKAVVTTVGGAFGGKFVLLEPFCSALAWLVKRPVTLSYYRMEDLAAANPATDAIIEIKTGAKKDGTLTALQSRVIFDTGAYPGSPVWIAAVMLTAYYRIPNYDVEGFEVLTHRVGSGAYRAPGAPQATFAIESQIDALAHALNIDPVEFRMKNAVVEGDKAMGRPYPAIGLIDTINRAISTDLWKNRANKGPNEGIGIAIGGWMGGLEPASAMCRLDQDGNFTLTTGVADISGVSTTLGLIAAEVLNADIDDIAIINADSDAAPFVGGSGGSKTTYTLGAAVRRAAQDARDQILKIAGEKLEANPADLELQDGKISVKGLPSRSITLREIANMSMSFGGRYEPVLGRGSSAITSQAPGFATHIAHVKVDPETGDVQVLNYVAAQDVGFAINPAEVEGQIHGGVTQGLGWALYEQLVYDENGALISGSLMDYAIQTSSQVPPIQAELVFVPSLDGPFGAKGVGEPPIVPGGATIANAIYDAVGVRVNQIPATPERLLQAVQSKANDKITRNNAS